jgi:predicted dehydrogenase
MKNSRRDFIKKAGLGSAAITLGGTVFGLDAKSYSRVMGANSRIRIAHVGVNSRGDELAKNFVKQKNAEIIYICDVDERAIAKTIATVTSAGQPAPKGEKDFRIALKDKTLDAFVIATPDHWHVPGTILACQAGKHVYCEKPLSHNPNEGELAVQAARKYNRIVQLGTQRRSSPSDIEGIQELKNGIIGRVYFGRAWYNRARTSIGFGKEAPVPAWLDYDLWQGPAPRRVYKNNVIHYNWHWFWHWGTGEALNNGTHEMDVIRWGLGADFPIRVSSLGGRYAFKDDWETPDTQIITFDFPNNTSAVWQGISCNGKYEIGSLFYGEKGRMELNEDGYTIFDLEGKIVKDVKREDLMSGPPTTVTSSPIKDELHVANFLESISDNKLPNADVETGHKSTLLVQLGNISYRVGRTLNIDPKNGHILGDPEALKLWSREYEKGWEPVV